MKALDKTLINERKVALFSEVTRPFSLLYTIGSVKLYRQDTPMKETVYIYTDLSIIMENNTPLIRKPHISTIFDENMFSNLCASIENSATTGDPTA
ncbi:hypothetical protein GCM10025858_38070 [Alicyclobacillus sacchari]|nr:hypothetical protein GCM10025858_38070 [Alicyclobacillus sacchari]